METTSQKTKKCLYCAEEINYEAIKCKHCNEMLQLSQPTSFNSNPREKISTTEKAGYRIGHLLKRIGFGVVILTVVVLAFVYSKAQSDEGQLSFQLKEKTPQELRAELSEKEKSNPKEYLQDQTKMRSNLIGEKVIEGIIINNASIAIFKDVVLNVSFLSKTNAVIGSKEFIIYEILAPKERKTFKFKIFTPQETKGFAAEVVGAQPVN